MVLESIISPLKAERRPWELLFIGFIYSSFAIALSLWIFEEHAGLMSVFFTVMACIPLMYNTLKLEETKDLLIEKERNMLKEHSKALAFFVCLFLGITLSFTAWYIFLPKEASADLFSVQTNTIFTLNTSAASTDFFMKVLYNNMKVLTFCILFSFFYGSGAIFVLTWNASVIATAIGAFVKNQLIHTASAGVANSYIISVSYGLLRYLTHGIPEILAYFVAALAGGIISVAIIRHDYRTKNFQKILFDSSNLLLISIVILVIAAFIEAYITPLMF